MVQLYPRVFCPFELVCLSWMPIVDFHFKGKVSFNNRSLHAIGDAPNPYEKAISIIGKTMAPFDEDNLIPCFGFGDGRFSPWKLNSNNVDSSFAPYNSAVELIFLFIYTATTHDQEVFSFHSDHSPCHGFEEVLACYKKIVPNLRLSGLFLAYLMLEFGLLSIP